MDRFRRIMSGPFGISVVGRDLGAEHIGIAYELSFDTKGSKGSEVFLGSEDKGLSNYD